MYDYFMAPTAPSPKTICAATPLEFGQRRLTLHRYGRFKVNVIGDRHCGPENGRGVMPCDYDVRIECGADELDEDGFLIEQLQIHSYFIDLEERLTKLSCELMAVQTAVDLHDLVMDQNPNCEVHSIQVNLSPQPHRIKASRKPTNGADVTFIWHSAQGPIRAFADRPRGDRLKTKDPKTWVTAYGEVLRVEQMEDEHLANAFRFVVRRQGYASPQAAAFLDEMNRRSNR